MSGSVTSSTDAANLLRTAAPGASVLGATASPGVGRIGWNATPHPRPLAAIACRNVGDVVGALGAVRDHGLPVSVMGGGVDVWHRHVRQDGVVLDLARMNGVTVDARTEEVTVGGGATTADLFGALPEDRVVPTGTVTYVGLAGLAMGGGYGLLTGRLGLTLDQLVRIELVLADGRVVRADRHEEADIFWAARGGGSCLGVATSLTFRTTPLPRVTAATVAVGLDDAVAALLAVQDLLDAHPDALSITSSFAGLPDGRTGLALAACWAGDESAGEAAMARLRSLRGASVLARVEGAYRRAFRTDARWPFGLHYLGDTRSIERLTAPVVERLVDCARQLPSPTSSLFLHDFHGAASRVAADATAFPMRRDHFVVGIVASRPAERAGDEERHRAWACATAERLDPVALPGGYINFLGPEQEDRVRQFYGGAAERLGRVRRAVDPDGIFAGGTGSFA